MQHEEQITWDRKEEKPTDTNSQLMFMDDEYE